MNSKSKKASVVDEIIRFNQDRKPKRLRIKFQRMSENVFAFFRGTNHLFARCWPELRPPQVGPEILICGDLHLENFGGYQTPDQGFCFDINDFDEALVAPCGIDLVRCTTSILLAADRCRFPQNQISRMAQKFLEQYRETIVETVKRLEGGDAIPGSGESSMWDFVGVNVLGTPTDVLNHHTIETKTGERHIVRNHNHLKIRRRRAAHLQKAVERYGRDLGKPEFYKVLDLTGRISGLGSLGLRRYVVLVEGDSSPHDNTLLDIKEEPASCLLSCAKSPQPDYGGNEAQRVVSAQKHLQAFPPPLLGTLQLDGRWYRVREMVPEENLFKLEGLESHSEKLRGAIERIGEITAWAQLRGSRRHGENRTALLAAWASNSNLNDVLASANRFAEQTRNDYEEYKRAYVRGRFDT